MLTNEKIAEHHSIFICDYLTSVRDQFVAGNGIYWPEVVRRGIEKYFKDAIREATELFLTCSDCGEVLDSQSKVGKVRCLACDDINWSKVWDEEHKKIAEQAKRIEELQEVLSGFTENQEPTENRPKEEGD